MQTLGATVNRDSLAAVTLTATCSCTEQLLHPVFFTERPWQNTRSPALARALSPARRAGHESVTLLDYYNDTHKYLTAQGESKTSQCAHDPHYLPEYPYPCMHATCTHTQKKSPPPTPPLTMNKSSLVTGRSGCVVLLQEISTSSSGSSPSLIILKRGNRPMPALFLFFRTHPCLQLTSRALRGAGKVEEVPF